MAPRPIPTTPVTVTGISDATAIATGGFFSCALLASGAVQCWGHGTNGELGDGSNSDSGIPVPVTGISTAVAITAGAYHACAVLRNGFVKCWGYNGDGALGNGTKVDANVPVRDGAINRPPGWWPERCTPVHCSPMEP